MQDYKKLLAKTSDKYLGLSGPVWCLLAGICYGLLNLFAKLAFDQGFSVAHFMLLRHLSQIVYSFGFGAYIRGCDFNPSSYGLEIYLVLLLRSALNFASKLCQFSAVAFIPLTLSSIISFMTGPLIAAIIAFILIREKLSMVEGITIALGVLGTVILTMPQWFGFLGLDGDALEQRFEDDMNKYSTLYFIGIFIALISSGLDVCTIYIIRHMQDRIPKPLYAFASGIVSTAVMSVYCVFFDSSKWDMFANAEAFAYSFIGSFFGWVALECLINGAMVTKSALAKNAELCGVIVPYAFDVFWLGRQFLNTDALGLVLIILLQVYQAWSSMYQTVDTEETAEEEDECRQDEDKRVSDDFEVAC